MTLNGGFGGRYLKPATYMSVGDSITVGIGTTDPWSDSYRAPMNAIHPNLTSVGEFAKNGYNFSAVSGQKSDYFLANIGAWYAHHPADIVILMTGTNDPIVAPTITPVQSATNIASIISTCKGINAAVKTFVTAPINSTTPYDIYNANYDAIYAALPAALTGLSNVTLMLRPTFLAGDLLDGEHLNASGCAKFAAWLESYLAAAGY